MKHKNQEFYVTLRVYISEGEYPDKPLTEEGVRKILKTALNHPPELHERVEQSESPSGM